MADRLSKSQRSELMSKVKQKNTALELIVFFELKNRKIVFRKHVKGLPGSPDIVILPEKIAVFIDGDFWHGYRYSRWKHKMTDYWQQKIERNITRDKKNFARLRRAGWVVRRFWGHEVKSDPARVVDEIQDLLIAIQSLTDSED